MQAHFFESIEGWFNFRDLYDQALKDAPNGAVFVELGSWHGRSAAYMAVEIANSGKKIDFYCVDTWHGQLHAPGFPPGAVPNGGPIFESFRAGLSRGQVWHLIHPIQECSAFSAAMFADQSVDFVMVDAAHDYASVRADVRAWLPKIKPGGLLAGDDAHWPGVLIGVHETIPFSEISLSNGGTNWSYRKARPPRGAWSILRDTPAVDYLLYIPYVNRLDLLQKAVLSVQHLWPGVVIIDQSAEGLRPQEHPWCRQISGVFRSPPGTMSFTQMMNWARAEALARRADFLIFMHNDAEVLGSGALKALHFARHHPHVGVVFTYYDAFAVFRVEALKDVGPWDETFNWYYSDNDYYRRMRLCGWQCHDFGGREVIHHGSQTLHSDPLISHEVAVRGNWAAAHYSHKWGGAQGRERFLIPYNGQPWT